MRLVELFAQGAPAWRLRSRVRLALVLASFGVSALLLLGFVAGSSVPFQDQASQAGLSDLFALGGLSFSSVSSVGVGDVNGDGRIDFLAAGLSQSCAPNVPFYRLFLSSPTSDSFSDGDSWLAELKVDKYGYGKPSVIVMLRSGGILGADALLIFIGHSLYFVNTGSSLQLSTELAPSNVTGAYALDLYNVAVDSLLIVPSSTASYLQLRLANGSFAESSSSVIGLPAGLQIVTTVTDLNGDGYQDALIGGWFLGGDRSYSVMNQKNGTLIASLVNLAPILAGCYAVADFDSDGDMDVFVVGRTRMDFYYQYASTAMNSTLTIEFTFSGTGSQAICAAAEKDVILNDGNSISIVSLNSTTKNLFTRPLPVVANFSFDVALGMPRNLPAASNSFYLFGELSSSVHPAVAIKSVSGEMYLDNSNIFQDEQITKPVSLLYSTAVVIDFDRDGCQDLFYRGVVPQGIESVVITSLRRGDCRGSFSTAAAISPPPTYTNSDSFSLWSDFDSDGYFDLLLQTEASFVFYFNQQGSLTLSNISFAPALMFGPNPVAAVCSLSASGGRFFIYANFSGFYLYRFQGSNQMFVKADCPSCPLSYSVPSGQAACLPSAIDSERDDIVVAILDYQTSTSFYISNYANGSLGFRSLQDVLGVAVNQFANTPAVATGDLFGDGVSRIVVLASVESGSSCSHFARFPNGTYYSAAPIASPSISGVIFRQLYADFDGDGLRDFLYTVQSASAYQLLLMRSNGNATFSDVTLDFLPASFTSIASGALVGGQLSSAVDDRFGIFVSGFNLNCGAYLFSRSQSATGSTTGTQTDAPTGAPSSATVGLAGLAALGLLPVLFFCCCICLVATVLCACFMLVFVVTVVAAVLAGIVVLVVGSAGVSVGAAAIGLRRSSQHGRQTSNHVASLAGLKIIDASDVVPVRLIRSTVVCEIAVAKWFDVDVLIKRTNSLSMAEFEQLAKEARMMDAIGYHPNVVPLLGVVVTSDGLSLVTEFCAGGSLQDALLRGAIPDDSKAAILLDVASGLSFVHRQGFVHRDVAARNVVLHVSGDAKLADFGRCERVGARIEGGAGDLGPVRWSAPEALDGRLCTREADMYAFGVLMWEVWSDGEVPFGEHATLAAVSLAIRRGERPSMLDRMPASQSDLARRLWAADPLARPSAETVHRELRAAVVHRGSLRVADLAEPVQTDPSLQYVCATNLATPSEGQ